MLLVKFLGATNKFVSLNNPNLHLDLKSNTGHLSHHINRFHQHTDLCGFCSFPKPYPNPNSIILPQSTCNCFTSSHRMATDSSEPTRRKHHRSSSNDDAEERSKRRKHRHSHKHRHHHRHRSNKDKEGTPVPVSEEFESEKTDDIEVEKRKFEDNGDESAGSLGEVLVSTGSKLAGLDYEMEEGEIVDEDGLAAFVNDGLEKSKNNLNSDVEFGEIEMTGYDDSNMVCSDSPRSIFTSLFYNDILLDPGALFGFFYCLFFYLFRMKIT